MSAKSSRASLKGSRQSITKEVENESFCGYPENYIDPAESVKPEFIYGGPFIKSQKPDPFLDTRTPVNLILQGIFKKSFAYKSLTDRMPVIITKVIDQLSKKGGGTEVVAEISKMKNELVTNKKFTPLHSKSDDAKRWNEWIDNFPSKYYYQNAWVYTECYVYRRMKDAMEMSSSLKDFDPFQDQKSKSFTDSVEFMCQVADKLTQDMLGDSNKDKKKADFVTLLKICLWSNKCDLSLSCGERVSLNTASVADVKAVSDKNTGKNADKKSEVNCGVFDPFQMIIDCKDKILADDSAKIFDTIVAKAEQMTKNIEGNTVFKSKCSCDRLAVAAGIPLCKNESRQVSFTEKKPESAEQAEEVNEIPCPAKITIPSTVYLDIVCDNAGYELFSDLCIAHFVLTHNLVQKVRFHVKRIPWFVSDVTVNDFKYVIDSCAGASFSKNLPPDPVPEPAEGEEPQIPEPKVLTSENLKQLGSAFQEHFQNGTFIVMDDTFWTSPHVYKDMKRIEPNLYRKLQLATFIIFKGDLNYRKLLGEKNWNPCTSFEPALQGFIPAPLAAIRTIKADLVCGLAKGKYETLMTADPDWMEKGDYGLIQMCGKAEALKISDRPCIDYGDTCKGTVCPVHTDL